MSIVGRQNLRSVLIAGALLGVGAGSLWAQSTADQPMPRASERAQWVALVDVRASEDIRDEIDAVRADERDADRQVRETERMVDRTKARIKVQKEEIDTFKARADLAKAEERESDRLTIERDRAMAELELKLTERMRELYESEHAWAESRQRTARAGIDLLEAELQLAREREARASGPDSTMAAGPTVATIEAEKRYLQLRKTYVSRLEQSASRERSVIDRRLRVAEAQIAVLGFQGT